MGQNVQSGSRGDEENSTDSGHYEWHWWYSMLGATIILAIVFVISRWLHEAASIGAFGLEASWRKLMSRIVARLQQAPNFKPQTHFGLEIASCPFQYGRVRKAGMKMGEQKMVPVAFRKSGLATDSASVAITVARLFGLDAGDWSMILLGLALSALLLVLAWSGIRLRARTSPSVMSFGMTSGLATGATNRDAYATPEKLISL